MGRRHLITVAGFLLLTAGSRLAATMPVVQEAYLKAFNSGAGDRFGTSVSVSGLTIVVGAPEEDSNATSVNGNPANNSASNAGAAFVFVHDGDAWFQEAYLKAFNAYAEDFFGTAVAVGGDTVVVGAIGEGGRDSFRPPLHLRAAP